MIASEKFAGDFSFIQNLVEPGKGVANYNFTLFDFVPCNMFLLQVSSGNILYLNRSFAADLGINKQDIIAPLQLRHLIYHGEDIIGLQQQLAQFNTITEGAQHAFELNLKVAESCKTFLLKGCLVAKEEGAAEYILFVAEDHTDLVITKQELHDKEELSADSESLLHFGCWKWQTTSDKMQWSDGIYALLGYNRGEVEESASAFMEHVHTADTGTVTGCMRAAIDSHTSFDCTYRLITKSGQELTVNSKGKIVASNNDEVVLIGITHDVTEQAQSHQALLNYRQMMLEKEFFLNHGSWEYDLDSNTMSGSDGFFRLFGYDTAIEKPGLDRNFFGKHILPEEIEKIRALLRSELHAKDNYVFEFSLTNKDGEPKQVESYGKVIRGDDKRVKRVIGASRDVTRMRKYERTLEQKIQQLNRSNADLEDFAYVASHDLQEPLRKIITFSERIIEKYSSVLTGDGVNYLQRMMSAAGNMRSLIENLLEFSRLRLKNEPSKLLPLDTIVDEVLNDLELKIEETNAVIEHSGLPTIHAYPSQVKQLIMNLVNNAIKFAKAGENPHIKIIGSTLTPHQIEKYQLAGSGRWYQVQFIDNGIGFDQEHAQKIFQLFQRLHSKAEYAGSGIGLSICKKIVENHGGQVFATSEPGKGAVFTVLLPAEYHNL
jgi:PAS domain S-box-containing protein